MFDFSSFIFPAAGEDTHHSYVVHRIGQRATLPCGTHQLQNCDNINWLFYNFGHNQTQRLINKSGKAISERLHFTDECSLVIKEVRIEDVGQYSCRDEGEHHRDHTNWFFGVITGEFLHLFMH